MYSQRQVVAIVAVTAVSVGVLMVLALHAMRVAEASRARLQQRQEVVRSVLRRVEALGKRRGALRSPSAPLSSPLLPSAPDEAFHGRLNCTGVEAVVRSRQLLENSDYTGCPNELDWLTLYHAVSPTVRDKVFVNVGAWKGYEVLAWLEIWAPHYLLRKKLNRTSWIAGFPPGCGYCGQCSTPQDRPYLAWNVLEEASGVDVAAPRVFAYEPLRSLAPSLKALVSRYGLEGNVHFGTEAFGGRPAASVEFPDCPQDREDCGIDMAPGVPRVPVKLTTVDEQFELHRWGHISYLSIDAEGNDYAVVVQGARGVLSRQQVDIVSFEYHGVGAWKLYRLEDLVHQLDVWGYDCFLEGKSGNMWRLTGCWDVRLEFRANSRVVCATRLRGYIRYVFESLRAPRRPLMHAT